MSVFINFFNIINWVMTPIYTILLAIDGIVYSLVAYAYKLFMIMTQLNFNVIYSWVAPLLDRIQAVIMVLIMFKLGYSLIVYMVDPEKSTNAQTGGVSLIKNIAIVTGLLIIYSTVFSLLNELSLLIVGVPEGYEFSTINQFFDVEQLEEQDSGLISRFIFGSEKNENLKNFGNYLSTSVLHIFLHSKQGAQTKTVERIYSQMQNAPVDTFDLMEITAVASDIFGEGEVEYKFPILSTAVGIYIVYSIVMIAIEVGVRMFKIIVLQILAPIAIVSILKDGMNSSVWKNFLKVYASNFYSVFIRIAGLFITCALISLFWNDKAMLMPDGNGLLTDMFLFIIIVIAGFRFSSSLPAFIDSVLGTKMADSKNASLGSFLKGAAGFAVGGAIGAITGAKTGAGFLGTLGNALGGATRGASSGFKGKDIASQWKGAQENWKKSNEKADLIRRQGGGLSYAGKKIMAPLSAYQNRRVDRLKEREAAYQDLYDAKKNALAKSKETYKDENGINTGIEFGADKDAFVEQALQYEFDHDSALLTSQAKLEQARRYGLSGEKFVNEIDERKREIRTKNTKGLATAWDNAFNSVEENSEIKAARRRAQKTAGANTLKIFGGSTSARNNAAKNGNSDALETVIKDAKSSAEKHMQTDAYEVSHRTDGNGGNKQN